MINQSTYLHYVIKKGLTRAQVKPQPGHKRGRSPRYRSTFCCPAFSGVLFSGFFVQKNRPGERSRHQYNGKCRTTIFRAKLPRLNAKEWYKRVYKPNKPFGIGGPTVEQNCDISSTAPHFPFITAPLGKITPPEVSLFASDLHH